MKLSNFVSVSKLKTVGKTPTGQPARCRRYFMAVAMLFSVPLSWAATRNVTISNFAFTDAVSNNSITVINAGDKVQWSWSAGTHSTTSGTCSGPGSCTPSGTWDSTVLSAPNTFSFTFNNDGSFPYYCQIHTTSMLAKVIVNPVVTNTNDSGPGSLRQAILDVNASPDLTTITFNIPGNGVHTIMPLSALPTLTNPMVIDGYTQPGASVNNQSVGDNANLVIELSGGSAGSANGLLITGGNTTVRGLTINGFSGNGIALQSGNNIIIGNFIGTNSRGTISLGNHQDGIFSSANNTIGGNTRAERNIISGNQSSGVEINGTANNLIQGNYIGTDVTGTMALGNSIGVSLVTDRATSNTIGGTFGAGNLISGNSTYGIEMSDAISNQVEGNLIGTNAAGNAAIPNGTGIYLTGFARGNLIGGTIPFTRNVISGNSGDGITFTGVNNGFNGVIGNFIGTDAAGTTSLGNGANGVSILNGSHANAIGDSSAGAGNVISSNGLNGINISGVGANGNTVRGNLIGTDVTDIASLGNHLNGVLVDTGTNSTIGGVAIGSGNTIAFNGKGVVVINNLAIGNAIETNAIFSNSGLGIDLGDDGVTLNTPGGFHIGPNGLQNYPVLTAAAFDGASTSVLGILNSAANTTFRIEYFLNQTCGPFDHGQGQTFLVGGNTGTDPNGNASVDNFFTAGNTSGKFITATATDPSGGTSEFSACQQVDYPLTNVAGRNLHVRLGKAVPLVVASFTDTDPNGSAGQFSTTSIDWGDRTGPSTGTVVSTGGQNYNVIGMHAYTKVGGWNVRVTINDSGGSIATANSKARLWPKPLSY